MVDSIFFRCLTGLLFRSHGIQILGYSYLEQYVQLIFYHGSFITSHACGDSVKYFPNCVHGIDAHQGACTLGSPDHWPVHRGGTSGPWSLRAFSACCPRRPSQSSSPEKKIKGWSRKAFKRKKSLLAICRSHSKFWGTMILVPTHTICMEATASRDDMSSTGVSSSSSGLTAKNPKGKKSPRSWSWRSPWT